MSERDLRRLLQAIYDLSTLPFPYESDATIPDVIIHTLGQIGGLCSRALAETQDREAGDG